MKLTGKQKEYIKSVARVQEEDLRLMYERGYEDGMHAVLTQKTKKGAK